MKSGEFGEADQPFQKVFYDKHVPCSYTVPQDIGETSDPNWRAIYQAARDHGDKVVVEDFVSGANITLVNTSNGVFGFAICRDVLDLAGVGNPLERYLEGLSTSWGTSKSRPADSGKSQRPDKIFMPLLSGGQRER